MDSLSVKFTKTLMPKQCEPSRRHTNAVRKIIDALKNGEPHSDHIFMDVLNLYRAMHDQNPVPWGSMAKKGYEFIIDNVDFKKITHLEVRSLLIRMGLESQITHHFKKMTISSELEL